MIPLKRDWAHVVDINKPMSQARFKQLVPDMAHKVRVGRLRFYKGSDTFVVPIRAGYVSKGGSLSSRTRGFRICCSSYFSWKNCRCRIRYSFGS